MNLNSTSRGYGLRIITTGARSTPWGINTCVFSFTPSRITTSTSRQLPSSLVKAGRSLLPRMKLCGSEHDETVTNDNASSSLRRRRTGGTLRLSSR